MTTTTKKPVQGWLVVRDVLVTYDQQITANRSPEWDTYVAVAEDDTGEVASEIEDTAAEMGVLDEYLAVDEQFRDESVKEYKRKLSRRVANERLAAAQADLAALHERLRLVASVADLGYAAGCVEEAARHLRSTLA